jgi:hypothetical protein
MSSKPDCETCDETPGLCGEHEDYWDALRSRLDDEAHDKWADWSRE